MLTTDTIGGLFRSLSEMFYRAFLAVDDVPFIGGLLDDPFLDASSWFLKIAFAIEDFGDEVAEIRDSVLEIVGLESILETIRDEFALIGDFWGNVALGVKDWLVLNLEDFAEEQQERIVKIGRKILLWAWD